MIVIPMAGASRRFAAAGYDVPKYRLDLHGRSVFAHAVASFEGLFGSAAFVFVARREDGVESFIHQECAALGVANVAVVVLDAATAGQAETVERGLDAIAEDPGAPLTIFNIDTFRAGFRYPDTAWFGRSDGYLEVFRGSGANWSYVEPVPGLEPLVARTAEKRQISDLCCDGLYHFATGDGFRRALVRERARPSAPELYVAPLYNHLIAEGGRVHYTLVDAACITFCGVPAEYEAARQLRPPP